MSLDSNTKYSKTSNVAQWCKNLLNGRLAQDRFTTVIHLFSDKNISYVCITINKNVLSALLNKIKVIINKSSKAHKMC